MDPNLLKDLKARLGSGPASPARCLPAERNPVDVGLAEMHSAHMRLYGNTASTLCQIVGLRAHMKELQSRFESAVEERSLAAFLRAGAAGQYAQAQPQADTNVGAHISSAKQLLLYVLMHTHISMHPSSIIHHPSSMSD